MLRATLLAAALLVPLAGASAQQQGERYRYLGRIGSFAVMTTEATGPKIDRRLTAIAADSTGGGPRGADNGVLEMTIDCTANRVDARRATLYRGDEQLYSGAEGGEPIAPEPESPNGLLFRFACNGEVPEGEAIWIEGEAAARHYALAQIKTD